MYINDNALAWYEYALRTGDDSVAKFMMNWIAFNFMYGEYRKKDDRGVWNTERERISLLCHSRFRDLNRYNPFVEDREAIETLIELPVLKGRRFPEWRGGPRLPYDSARKPHEMTPAELWGVASLGDGPRRVECLLLTLYQVRCNLFHGSKDPTYIRDLELVESAGIVLEGYIKALLHIDSSPH